MNRRSFLGFAVGGVVAAPAAILVGEKAAIQPLQTVTVDLSNVVTAEQAHRIVAVAMRQAEEIRRRGGFAEIQRNSSRLA